jgi:hypothetical protein
MVAVIVRVPDVHRPETGESVWGLDVWDMPETRPLAKRPTTPPNRARRPADRNPMTAVSPSFQHSEPARVIDVRCSAALPSRRSQEGRCQLFAGHDGPHALMFARAGERLVRTWRTNGAPSDSSAMQRPWMFGFPMPAWFESDSSAKRTG